MPQEDRFIMFNYEEVYTALRIRSITQKTEIPTDGEIENIVFGEENQADSTVSIALKKTDGSIEKLDFTLEFFANALVFFCQGNNIPIPRAGKKEIMQKNGKIMLHIHIP